MKLSRPISQIKPRYDVVVVGSGYGGAIAAARLAAVRSVCVLERGKEVRPAQYSDSLPELIANTQIDTPRKHRGDHTALYDFRLNKEINVYQGCGLGGTSLLNANVAFRPDARVFQASQWPAEIRDAPEALTPFYDAAAAVLDPKPHPRAMQLHKVQAHKRSADAMPGYRHALTDLTLSFDEGVNPYGVHMSPCVDCGDCITGCNHRAKNTLITNYLPMAWSHGAEIFCEVGVRWLEPSGDGWLVRFDLLDSGGERFDAPPMFVRADVVVLGAGSLGTTEILLRSRDRAKLPVSNRLGAAFSGNGDVIGFAYNCDDDIDGVGFGDARPREREPVGPCIVSVIDNQQDDQKLEDRRIIQEGAVPGGIAAFLAPTFAWCSAFVGRDTDFGFFDWLREKFRQLWGLFAGPRTGATERTQTYLVMGHDGQGGTIQLVRDRARISWRGAGAIDHVQRSNADMHDATAALGGTYVKNPIWTRLFRRRLIATHPLGGCGMGDDAKTGVIDHKGRVFNGSGNEVHDGLYVTCGAAIPRSIGVNPFLTISALAERTCAKLIEDRGWDAHGNTRPYEDRPDDEPTPIGLRFTERMRGHFSTTVKDAPTADTFSAAQGSPSHYAPYRAGAKQGRADGSHFAFTLTIVTEDLDDMLANPGHEAHLAGTAVAPTLDERPLRATGRFRLLVPDPADPTAKRMTYRFEMVSEDGGKRYSFEGFKDVRDDPGFDVWSDTSTLYVTIRDDDGIVGQGVLRIKPRDFLRQMRTLRVLRSPSWSRTTEAKVDFARAFLGDLAETYLPVLADPRSWLRRSLRVGWRLVWMPVAALLVVGLITFAWRPNVLRNQPLLAADGPTLQGAPDEVAALAEFPQYLRDVDLSPGAYDTVALTLTADWDADTDVQTHGGLAPITFKPDEVPRLSEATLRKGYLTLQRIHEGTLDDPIAGLGSQIETARFTTGVLSNNVTTDSEWSITFADGSVLFLTQNEGGPELPALRAQAPWSGNERVNHTLGPLPGQYGIVLGGTGRFEGAIGQFQEINYITAVVGTDMSGSTEMNIEAIVPRAPRIATGTVTRERRFHLRAGDLVYDLDDPVGVATRLVKLRDRRDVVAGLLGTSRAGGQPAQMTITLPGDGTIFAVPDGDRYRIIDGTGRFARAIGHIEETRDGQEVILRWGPRAAGLNDAR